MPWCEAVGQLTILVTHIAKYMHLMGYIGDLWTDEE